MNSNRKYNDEPSANDGAIGEAVRKLIKEGFKDRIPASYIEELKRKYNDIQLVDKIQEAYYEKVTDLRRRAIKFTKLIERKYGGMGYPLHVVLNKALKYKKKYELSDSEFEMFRQLYERTMNPRNRPGAVSILAPNTNMAKVFGDPNSQDKGLGSEDTKSIREIVALYEAERRLHAQVSLQSVTYGEYDIAAMSGKHDPNSHNKNSFVHPVLAAMFLPKIELFERHFLHSNLAYIVKSKQFGDEASNTYPNYMLLHSLVYDPTDVVCSNESPMMDIKHRASLQVSIWNNVQALRNGRYYDSGFERHAANFMVNIDSCRISNYDAPDLVYFGDESVVLRRIFNAFSLRPTIVSTFPLTGYQTYNQVNFPVLVNSVTAIPMLHVRLPIHPTIGNNMAVSVNLEDSLQQPSFMVENGVFTARNQQVIYTDGVLVFNVPRRTYHPLANVSQMFQPTNFNNLPKNLVGMEKINEHPVTPLPGNFPIGDINVDIKSVVALTTHQPNNTTSVTDKMVKGCCTLLFNNNGAIQYVYDPSDTTNPVNNAYNGDYAKEGVIFIYTKN
jgi:hypothetical protein